MTEAVTDSKDPAKVRAGRAGAAVRWTPARRRRVRLDDLTPEKRRLVLALVEQLATES